MREKPGKNGGLGRSAGKPKAFSVNGLHLKTRRQVDLNLGPPHLGSELCLPCVSLNDHTSWSSVVVVFS